LKGRYVKGDIPRLRIAEVVSSFYPNVGGLENAVYFLSKEMVELRHEVHVFTLSKIPKKQTSKENFGKISLHRIWTPFYHLPLEPFPVILKDISLFDVIHVHSIHNLLNLQAMFASKVLGIPLVVTLFSVGDLMKHPRLTIRLLGGFFEKVGLSMARFADVIHVKNIRDRALLLKLGFNKRKIHVIPDGVPDYALASIDGNIFRSKYGLANKRIVLYVGRLQYPKGPQVLLRAAPKVIRCVPNTVFVFMGSDAGIMDELLSTASSLGIEGHILLLGYVSELTKFQAYAACDLLVLPSLYDYVEAYSIVTSEAWAQGKAVIATMVGSMPYRIKHRVNGLLVPPGDSVKLAGAIIEVLKNPEMSRRLGENGKSEVHTWREVAQAIQKVYFEAVQKRRCKDCSEGVE
jgi:glycosyltransferase involved in cell wall biosynthesis